MPTLQDVKTKTPISIIVPMCNEEASLPLLKAKLSILQQRISADYMAEYCLVDDGSTDRTGELMSTCVPVDALCKLLHHEHNLGLGAAIQTGLHSATGAIVCTIDADCSYSPEDLGKLIQMVASGEADIAVASPYHPQGQVIGVKAWRLLLSSACSRLYRLLSPLKLYTYTSIFRAYRGAIVNDLRCDNPGFVSAAEVLLCAHRLGYSVGEVPMTLHARQRGYSKMRIAKTILGHLSMLWNSCIVHSSSRRDLSQSRPKHTRTLHMPTAPMASFAAQDDNSSIR